MIKRVFDIMASAVLLVMLAPMLLLIAVLVRLSSPGPVIFRQERAGRAGRPFQLLKFRSMHQRPTRTHETSRDDPRVFPVGRLLREYHLDELPQLWNVLRGDMSMVGPRPTLLSQVERYTPRERRRLDVRPGVTGLAQVSGNNMLDWEERIEIDLGYLRTASFTMDLTILWRTLGTVLRKDGVYGADGRVRDKAAAVAPPGRA